MDIVEQVKATIVEKQLLRRGAAIVVAVSGGVDSMALLHILHRLSHWNQFTIIAAHVNHGFREQESAAEAELVTRYCEQLGIKLEKTELHMPQYLLQTKENSQAASRKRRYQFFYEVAEHHRSGVIALAHHADDQAETIFMHVLRGTGLTGLKGMEIRRLEKNVELIRPLLRMRKNELRQYCLEEQVPYLEDSSNQLRHYQRNEIRLDIFPQLERFNPQLVPSLCRLAELASDEEAWLNEQTEQLFNDIVTENVNCYMLNCDTLNARPIALQRRLIKLILSYLSQDEDVVSFEGIERIRAMARQDAKSIDRIDVGAGLICIREYEQLRFVHINSYNDVGSLITPLSVYPEHIPCELQYGDWLIKARIISKQQQPQLHSKYEAVFDIEAITMPLTIRQRKSGDRMQVLGLNGTKKVQDMFVDAKIAASKRDHHPIVEDGAGKMIWLPGIRRSSHGLVNEGTQQLLFLQCIEHTDREVTVRDE